MKFEKKKKTIENRAKKHRINLKLKIKSLKIKPFQSKKHKFENKT